MATSAMPLPYRIEERAIGAFASTTRLDSALRRWSRPFNGQLARSLPRFRAATHCASATCQVRPAACIPGTGATALDAMRICSSSLAMRADLRRRIRGGCVLTPSVCRCFPDVRSPSTKREIGTSYERWSWTTRPGSSGFSAPTSSRPVCFGMQPVTSLRRRRC